MSNACLFINQIQTILNMLACASMGTSHLYSSREGWRKGVYTNTISSRVIFLVPRGQHISEKIRAKSKCFSFTMARILDGKLVARYEQLNFKSYNFFNFIYILKILLYVIGLLCILLTVVDSMQCSNLMQALRNGNFQLSIRPLCVYFKIIGELHMMSFIQNMQFYSELFKQGSFPPKFRSMIEVQAYNYKYNYRTSTTTREGICIYNKIFLIS